jgi:TolB-like protein
MAMNAETEDPMRVSSRLCRQFLIVFAFIAVSVAAEPIRLAVIDFQVQSDNTAYKYYGKGFAEFTVIELAKSNDVTVIAREKRNQALEELAFSLSDIADTAKQMRIGEFLTAQYLVGGSIFEMGGRLVVTVTVLDVEKGTTVFTDKASGEPGAYDGITASLAAKVLGYFKLKTPQAVAVKVEKAEVKPAETVERFSTAIDALDRKDTATAKTELAEAQKLDPNNDAVRIYLSRLTLNSAKFMIITELYYPLTNPAALGIIRYDKLDASIEFNAASQVLGDAVLSDCTLSELDFRGTLGYQVPIGGNFGLGVDGFFRWSIDQAYSIPSLVWDSMTSFLNTGGIVSFGWAPTETFSCGLGVSLYYKHSYQRALGTPVENDYFRQALSAGVLVRDPESTIVYDLLIGIPFDRSYRIDPAANGVISEVAPPLYVENTLTLALADRRLFLIFKQIDDLAFDRVFYFGRLLAAVEWWPADWLAMRASGEASLGLLEGTTSFGYGGLAGATFRIPGTGWAGWDLDVGVSYRQRPSRNVAGVLVPEFIPTVRLSKTGSFASR